MARSLFDLPDLLRAAPLTGQIQFSPIPANIQTGAAVSLRVSLVPTYDTDTLPDFLLDQWLMAIEEGAKALLMRMPQQEWSDPNGRVRGLDRIPARSRSRLAVLRCMTTRTAKTGDMHARPSL